MDSSDTPNGPNGPSTSSHDPNSKFALLQYFFQSKDGVDRKQMRITDVSLYSTTPWREANFISKTIMNFYSNGTLKSINPDKLPVITDATSNVGGNTISLYLSGAQKVNAVEMDAKTSEMLKHNLATYGLPTQSVYNSDYLDVYKKLEQDVVLMDPPWGGPTYKDEKIVDLYLSGVDIVKICAELIKENKASLIVLKVPLNYNLNRLVEEMPTYQVMIQKIYRKGRHLYNVIFCWGWAGGIPGGIPPIAPL